MQMKLMPWIGVLCLGCFARCGVAVPIRLGVHGSPRHGGNATHILGGNGLVADVSGSAVVTNSVNNSHAENVGEHIKDSSAVDPSDSTVLFKLLSGALAERGGARLEGFSEVDPKAFKATATALSVVTSLLEQVSVANNKTQQEVNAAAESLTSCSHPLDAKEESSGKAASLLAVSSESLLAQGAVQPTSMSSVTAKGLQAARKAESQCNSDKELLATQASACDSIVATKQTEKKTVCKVAAEDEPDVEACKPTQDEAYTAWAAKWKTHYEGKLKGIGAKAKECKKLMGEIAKLDAPLDKGEKESCAWKHQSKANKGEECKNTAGKVKIATCGYLNAFDELCRQYDSCYEEKTKAYTAVKATADAQVASQKLQWRLLKRADCLAGAYNDAGEVVKEKLDKCAAVSVHNTSHLDLTDPQLPLPQACSSAAPPITIDPNVASYCRGLSDCGLAIDGGGWTLVRHTKGSGGWGPWKDDLKGTAKEGKPGNSTAAHDWTIPWMSAPYQFLFTFGDCSSWLIAEPKQVNGEVHTAKKRWIAKSSEHPFAPYQATWLNRGKSHQQDPFVSVRNYHASGDWAHSDGGPVLYSETSAEGKSRHVALKNQHGGANVYIRNQPEGGSAKASAAKVSVERLGWSPSSVYGRLSHYSCKSGGFLDALYTRWSGSKQDREWKYSCNRVLPGNGVQVVENMAGIDMASTATDSFYSELNKPFTFECPAGSVIAGITSVPSASKKDRLFKFKCDALFGLEVVPNQLVSRYTEYHNNKQYDCDEPNINSALVGIETDTTTNDRRFRYRCATFGLRDMGFTMAYSKWSGFGNFAGRSMEDCGSGVLVGLGSIHDAKNKDRKWRYLCSSIQNPKKPLDMRQNIDDVNLGSTEASTFQTKMQSNWKFECPAGSVIAAVVSDDSDEKGDRRFKFKCNMPTNMHVTPQAWSPWSSDRDITHFCTSWSAISGMESFWIASSHTRRFRFKCALLWF